MLTEMYLRPKLLERSATITPASNMFMPTSMQELQWFLLQDAALQPIYMLVRGLGPTAPKTKMGFDHGGLS